jgi:hypothetical protein
MGSGASAMGAVAETSPEQLQAAIAEASPEQLMQLQTAIAEASPEQLRAAVAQASPEQLQTVRAYQQKLSEAINVIDGTESEANTTEVIEDLPSVCTTPPEYDAEGIASWSEKWYSPDSLKAAIGTGDTLFLDGKWLFGQAEENASLPKRQSLPEDAAIDTEAFLESLWDDVNCPYWITAAGSEEYGRTVGISYCWSTKENPDPTGEQLQRLKTPLKLMLKVVKALAIFLDWCSLYQAERNAEQDQAFKRGLKNVNIWYAHPLTWVWALTVVPAGVKAYAKRGWPRFEKAVSTLLKDSYMFMDLGCLEDKEFDDKEFDAIKSACTAARDPPIAPAAFREALKTLSFTSGSDRSFVLKKYEATFTEVLGCAEKLDYSRLDWGDSEMASLGEVLPWCCCAKTMDLSHLRNATIIPESITEMKACTKLDLTGCWGLESLPESIGNMEAMKELCLKECKSLTTLPESLGDLQALEVLDLRLCENLVPFPGLDKLRERGCKVHE